MAAVALPVLDEANQKKSITFGNEDGKKRSRTLESSRLRISQLARPKISKAVWETIEPPIVWGNQVSWQAQIFNGWLSRDYIIT